MLDFDQAVLRFMEWFEHKQEEQVIGPAPRQPGKNKAFVRKYKTIESIFEDYYPAEGSRAASRRPDPDVEAVDILDLFNDNEDDDGGP